MNIRHLFVFALLVFGCDGAERTCESPANEVVDGIDNDCDGLVDDHIARSCYSGPVATAGIGLCFNGVQTYADGAWSTCVGEVLPSTDIYDNGLDEDCDGSDFGSGPRTACQRAVMDLAYGGNHRPDLIPREELARVQEVCADEERQHFEILEGIADQLNGDQPRPSFTTNDEVVAYFEPYNYAPPAP